MTSSKTEKTLINNYKEYYHEKLPENQEKEKITKRRFIHIEEDNDVKKPNLYKNQSKEKFTKFQIKQI